MLIVQRKLAWSMIGALGVVLVLWLSYVLWSTRPFQDCLGEQEKHYKAAHKTKENPPKGFFALFVNSRDDTVCVLHVLYEYRDAVNALATVLIAAFTFTLWRSTKNLWREARIASRIAYKAADATKRSVELANREFISTHRPKIIIRRVSLDIRPTDKGESAQIEYVVSNIGDTSATVIESNATTQILRSDYPQEIGGTIFPSVLPFSGQTNAIPNRSYAPGATDAFIAFTDLDLSSARWGAVRGHATIIFFGYIIYEDGNGVVRRTQFCRVYDHATQCFTVADAEHDYAS